MEVEPSAALEPQLCAVCGGGLPSESLPPSLFDLTLTGGRPAAAAVLPLRRLDVTSEWRLCTDCTALLERRQRLRTAAELRAAEDELDRWAAQVTSGAGESPGPAAEPRSGDPGDADGQAGHPETVTRDSVSPSDGTADPVDADGQADRQQAVPGGDASPCDRTESTENAMGKNDSPVPVPKDNVILSDRTDTLSSQTRCSTEDKVSSSDRTKDGGATTSPPDRAEDPEEDDEDSVSPPAASSDPGTPAELVTLQQRLASVERQLQDRLAAISVEDKDLIPLKYNATYADNLGLPPCLEGSGVLCNLCGEKFSTEELQPHLESHKERRKQCPVCHRWISTTYYTRHMLIHSSARPYKCEKCQFTSKHRAARNVHRRSHCEKEKYVAYVPCSICPMKYVSKHGPRYHLLHTGGGQHKCPMCAKAFTARSHNLPVDKMNNYNCDVCGKLFYSKGRLSRHMKIFHEDGKRHKCSKCTLAFHYKRQLKLHMVVHTDVRPFTCSLCGKAFKRQDGLECHRERHGSQVNFKCSECFTVFQARTALSEHIKLHKSTEEKHSCELCGATFITAEHLKRHMLAQSNVGHLACRYCLHRFETEHILRSHEQTHFAAEQSGQFPCSQCERAFTTNTGLRKHVTKMHAHVPNALRCDSCANVFFHADTLAIHRSSCARNKKVACNECGKRFKDSYALNVHKVVHSDAKPFTCSICSASYKYKHSLNLHRSQRHGDTRNPAAGADNSSR